MSWLPARTPTVVSEGLLCVAASSDSYRSFGELYQGVSPIARLRM